MNAMPTLADWSYSSLQPSTVSRGFIPSSWLIFPSSAQVCHLLIILNILICTLLHDLLLNGLFTTKIFIIKSPSHGTHSSSSCCNILSSPSDAKFIKSFRHAELYYGASTTWRGAHFGRDGNQSLSIWPDLPSRLDKCLLVMS